MNKISPDSPDRLAGMRRLKSRIAYQWNRQDVSLRLPIGHGTIDAALGGGIACARLHEIFAASPDDAASAAGFAAMLAHQRGGAVFWVRQERIWGSGALHGEGVAEIGLDPTRLLLCTVPAAADVLKAANEAARCPHVSTVIAELWQQPRELSLTASRRLALSAEISGATLLLLRVDAAPEPSAATTRWSVAAAPSTPLAANAPGLTTLDLALLRQRGQAGEGQWRVLWDRDHGRFVEAHADGAPLSGAVRAPAVLRPAELGSARRAA